MMEAILTVIMSGVVAAFVSFVLSSKRETFLYKQKKAEDLFLAADRHIKLLSGIFVLHYPYVKGEISELDLKEMIIKSATRQQQDEKTSHAVLWMLTRFYFPEVAPALLDFDQKRSAVHSAVDLHKRINSGFNPFHKAFGEFNKASDALLDAIVAQGKKFNEIPIPFTRALGDMKLPSDPPLNPPGR